MRENEAVPAHADDPQADYEEDHDRDLIQRAPHAGSYFRANNKTICLMLKKICTNTPAYSYISSQTVNGRAAWLALMQNYLGPQHMQLQAAIHSFADDDPCSDDDLSLPSICFNSVLPGSSGSSYLPAQIHDRNVVHGHHYSLLLAG